MYYKLQGLDMHKYICIFKIFFLHTAGNLAEEAYIYSAQNVNLGKHFFR